MEESGGVGSGGGHPQRGSLVDVGLGTQHFQSSTPLKPYTLTPFFLFFFFFVLLGGGQTSSEIN